MSSLRCSSHSYRFRMISSRLASSPRRRGSILRVREVTGYVGVDGPRRHRCARMRSRRSQTKEPSMNDLIRIGMDTSKSVFVLHGVDAAEQPVLRRKLRLRQVVEFFDKLPAIKVGIEACGGAHYWAREHGALGHHVLLLPPQRVKPYVARNKNDAADAEAICEAMSRPRMRFGFPPSRERPKQTCTTHPSSVSL